MTRYRNPTILSCGDFQLFLHDELRSRELERVPPGARTVLHGGSAGGWYFDWFESCYPSEVERHIGVEAFLPRPDDLPENVEWLQRSLGDLSPVEDGTVDLVYAGEVIEHLWPEDVVGFLAESHRVLKPGGLLALDSPNRDVTALADWNHIEHTLELTPAEIRMLLTRAGFDDVGVRGIWLAYDREADRLLELETLEPDGDWTRQRRIEEAEDRPEDSFLWWAQGSRAARSPDRREIERMVDDAFREYRGRRFARLHSNVGSVAGQAGRQEVTAVEGEAGHLVFGPYVPMRGGRWLARFQIEHLPGGDPVGPDEIVGELDVTKDLEVQVLTARELLADELGRPGSPAEVTIPFELPQTEFGVQFRLFSNGRTGVRARLQVEIDEQTAPEPDTGGSLQSAALPSETDFNDFLHELRSRELEKLPTGARTVLHGGSAGSWYFEWFDERYPTQVEKHIGVEAFSPAPDPLPPKVEWLARTLGDLSPVEDSSVDLVFAGEVVEHLWPEDVAGFLVEAHRVLRPGGTIALDSPNRRVTEKLGWDHPEHTVEFTVDEARELLGLAGFDDVKIRGVWICFDAERNKVLPFDDLGEVEGWSSERRAAEAEGKPEDSFV